MIGKTLGHYLIVEQIGAGGMGVVYRAHDERLDRDVAIKVLPEEVAGDPERLARFEREAKLLASLNHPNIATLHGLEEENGQLFLVMELVEGESLASVISRGPIPVDESLPFALQIARALEAAHDHGIIHRDLKPANVMVDGEGQVKVLDFGLAKAWEREVVGADLTHSPTLSVQMTADGVILGTAAYMSPEQARGRSVDKRSDIWAFGVVLFEMLTGTRAFPGDSATDILATIIKDDPDWDALPVETPRSIRRLLRRCLTKRPEDRLHDIADARIVIAEAYDEDPAGAQTESPADPPLTTRVWVRFLPWVLVPIVALTVWVLRPVLSRVSDDRTGVAGYHRLEIGMPKGERLRGLPYRALALSPDGRTLAFASGPVMTMGLAPGSAPINLRALDVWENRPLPGTEGGSQPVFSPDGRWLLFMTEEGPADQLDRVRYLNRISLESGSTVQLCECDASFGATWGTDGTIVFAGYFGPLLQVPEAGGEPRTVTALDQKEGEISHRLPHFLPNGKAVIYTALTGTAGWSTAKVFVQDLETGERSLVIEGGADAEYVPSGHLLYAREDRLMAVPFDLGRRRVTGQAVPVLEGLSRSINIASSILEVGTVQVAFSESGVLAYAPGSVFQQPPKKLVAVDRDGQQEVLDADALDYFSVRVAGNNRDMVMYANYLQPDIWTFDAERRLARRQSFDGGSWPIWGPGPGQFTFAIKAPPAVAVKNLNADGRRMLPIEIPDTVYLVPSSWSPDARHLAVCSEDPVTGEDIWIYSAEDGVHPFLKTEFHESYPEFSPNGRWIAYVSDRSGSREVYVRPFPGPGSAVQISTTGGIEPAWSETGDELFFNSWTGETTEAYIDFFSVSIVEEDGSLRVGTPNRLFSHAYQVSMPVRAYDIRHDGRFVFVEIPDSAGEMHDDFFPDRIRIIEDWFAELERLAPTGKQ